MPIAHLTSHNVNYRQAGQGEDLILIHGLAANHAFWNLALLLPLAREYRVTVYDLRGHGYSEMPPRGYTSAELATDLVALMDHLHIETAHLAGHSFGGAVAMHCATRHPKRVRSLTLADTRVRALQPRQRLRDWPDWRQAKADLEQLGLTIDENADDVGLRLLEELASPQWRAMRKGLSKKGLFVPFRGWSEGNRSAKQWLRLLKTTTARQDVGAVAGLTLNRIRTVRHPTLAIYGERSRCMKTCEGLQRVLPSCTTVIVPKVGHFYPVIRPAFVARTLLEFLGRVSHLESSTVPRTVDKSKTAVAVRRGRAKSPRRPKSTIRVIGRTGT